MPTYPNEMGLYPKYIEVLKKIFVLRDEHRIGAEKLINEVMENANLDKTEAEATLVTVHSRRKDFKGHIKLFGKEIVSAEYFKKALEYIEKKYKNVIIIVLSDDIAWCRRNIKVSDLICSTIPYIKRDMVILGPPPHRSGKKGIFF